MPDTLRTRSLVCSKKPHTHHKYAATSQHSLRNGFAYNVLFGVPGF